MATNNCNNSQNQNVLLRQIELRSGTIRELTPFSLEIKKPVLVISGPNGCGKTSLLNLLACSFKSTSDYYYNFSDFFAKTKEEQSNPAFEIHYQYSQFGEPKEAIASRQENKRLTYTKRPDRSVLFLGMQRIVTPSEEAKKRRSAKEYQHLSNNLTEKDKKAILYYAQKILKRAYLDFSIQFPKNRKKTSKGTLSLPDGLLEVETPSGIYSGFNMSAGENSVFTILIWLFTLKPFSLFILDEAELGLHYDAQERLVDALFEISKQRKMQIILSTHSAIIYQKVRDDEDGQAVYMSNGKITEDVNSRACLSFLSVGGLGKVNVFVEDKAARSILMSIFSQNIKQRIDIRFGKEGCGKDDLMTFLNDCHKLGIEDVVVVLDGDAKSTTEEEKYEDIKDKVLCLPGDQPEITLLRELKKAGCEEFAQENGIDDIEGFKNDVDVYLTPGKHHDAIAGLYKFIYGNEVDEVSLMNFYRQIASYLEKKTHFFSDFLNDFKNLLDSIDEI